MGYSMRKNKTYHRKKTVLLWVLCMGMMVGLAGRLVYLCVFRSVYYSEKADDLHERERGIKAARGRILDANGEVLAANRTVCTISVIHSQIEEPEAVIAMLVKELGISEETARKRVEKRSSIERVKTNVDKKTGDTIRSYGYAGVKVDEDFKRYYPKGKLASRVIGFTGGDNQGIIGLEVEYEEILKGINGKILTTTDARGIEQNGIGESRQEPVAGRDLKVSLDVNIQAYCQQAAEKAMAEKQADSVSILLMNPQNGEIYACVNVPEFDLNDPFTLQQDTTGLSEKEIQDLLNQMWRTACINDTYEPGSTFKIITMSAGLSEGVVSPNDSFFCPGYKIVEDRRIHCHKRTGHGAENFVQGAQNSCNPVFIEVGLRLGVEKFCDYFRNFGLMEKTGIDLPGEASTIMHKEENIGEVELATMAFGQSFQITPIRLAASVTILNAVFFSVASIGLGNGVSPSPLAVIGSLLGFLVFNVFPARVFMGDTGSLALGGFVSGMACFLRLPLFLPLVGFIYMMEILSVILQVSFFKLTKGKRIFKMTPIHHHFELMGWSETQIVTVFATITAILCLIALMGL